MPTTLLLDKEEMTRILERLACEVLERHGQCERVMLVGIERRGADLARRLGALMQQKLQRPNISPLISQPLDILLDRLHVFLILLRRVRVVETEVADTAMAFSDAEI